MKREPFESGTYVLCNDRYGTALTLSMLDRRSISGGDFDPDGQPSQQWTFVETEKPHHFLIKSRIESALGEPLYLTVDKALRQDADIVAGLYPMTWEVGRGRTGRLIT
ncbi:hypothetical protein OH77DRAFT_1519211 [Trametes cingulata]|nr:hypothetical protein OH77DRAFT_1519211 [Trametes cingulata]